MHDPHIEWAIRALNTNGYQTNTTVPETILHTAWSTIYRFNTDKGFFFLKKVPASLSIEARVIDVLYNEFNAPVPRIIANNDELHCFLMKDAGVPLCDYFKDNFQADILINTMREYTQLQIMTAEKVNLFLNIGVPDWRLTNIPRLYEKLITEEALLMDGGITVDELQKLKELKPKLIAICEKLILYNIPDTFGHADLHDKNILIDANTHQTTLIDLGEVVITHPFFSLQNCLHRTTEHFSLSDLEYRQLQIACFQPWLALETEKNLIEILSLIQQCWSIHAVLGEYRLVKSVDPSAAKVLCKQDRFARKFRFWINQS